MAGKDLPYWDRNADYSGIPFFIRKMDTSGYVKASEIPAASLPLVGFLYLTDGELLAEVEGESFLCGPGHLLLIPQGLPFSIRYYDGSIGFTGGFSLSFLQDIHYACLHAARPLQQAFWFEEAVLNGDLFQAMETWFRSGSMDRIRKALDLVLCQLKTASSASFHPLVSQFLDRIFDRNERILSVSEYAGAMRVSPNYLNKVVKAQTRRSAIRWIDISRINLAKTLLRRQDLPVTEVATAVGLEDQSYFARFFKRHTGMTPTAFRSAMGKV